MRKLYLLTAFMLILSVVFANADFMTIGGDTQIFNADDGNFNANLESVDISTRNIGNPRLSPLVYDVNNDSIKEIIVMDGTDIKVYQGSGLTIKYGYSTGCDLNASITSNMVIANLDDDDYYEIVFICENSKRLEVIGFNSSSIFEKYQVSLSTLNFSSTTSEVQIGCGATNCLMAYGSGGSTTTTDKLYMTGFNYSSIGAEVLLDTETNNNAYCPPTMPEIQYKDYNQDGTTDFIFSVYNHDSGANDDILIYYADVDSSLLAVELQEIRHTEAISSGSGACQFGEESLGRHISSPVVFDIDPTVQNLETVIGMQVSTNEYVMRSYKANGDELDDYPETFEADGQILSNPMIMNVFTDTGSVDFCIMGYKATSGEIDLLCASEQTSVIPETREFKHDVSDYYNISIDYERYSILTYASQQMTDTTDGNNLDEVSTSYGIFYIDWSDVYTVQLGANILSLNLAYLNPKADIDAVTVMSDVEDVGLADMLVLDSTNLWYIDDGFQNSAGAIDEYTINPCLNSVWKLNTSYGISIKVTDPDGDNVQARYIIYNGTANEYDSDWSSSASSGTTFAFSGSVNETIALGKLTLMGRDVENEAEIDSIELTFSVGQNGVEFGDCTTTVSGLVEAEAEAESVADTEPTAGNNSIDDTVSPLAERTGLGTAIIWLLFMGGLAVALFIFNRNEEVTDDKVALIIIAVVEVIMLVVGTKLGYISSGVIWTLVILSLMGIGIAISSRLFGNKAQGG